MKSYFMERFYQLIPDDLYTKLKSALHYKIVVYPIMIDYYFDQNKKYDEKTVKTAVTKIIKSFKSELDKMVDDIKTPTNLFEKLKSYGGDFINIDIGMKVTILKKSIYYRNYKKST